MGVVTNFAMRAVATRGPAGEFRAPGAARPRRWHTPEAMDLVVFPHGESIDFYVGKKDIYAFSLPASVAVKMAWWLVRWWVLRCWFGTRLRVWHALLNRQYDEKLHGQAKAADVPRSPES